MAFLTFDRIGPRIGGSAVRAVELARACADAGHTAKVLTPELEGPPDAFPVPVQAFDPAAWSSLAPALAEAEVVVVPSDAFVRIPKLASLEAALVVDLYDPFYFELLSAPAGRESDAWAAEAEARRSVVAHALRRGDFFLCASERQRDMWLGALLALGRLAPGAADPDARGLIDVAPYGVAGTTPPARDEAVRAERFGAGRADTVILWGGALWAWQDPLTPIRAAGLLAARRSDIRLVFFTGASSRAGDLLTSEAEALAESLGLTDGPIRFIRGWVAYEERARMLASADAGLSAHRRDLESRFSYRTRLLDYLWAGLPIVCSRGDVLADVVEARGLGLTAPPGDAAALGAAFERIADDHAFAAACRQRIAATRPELAWGTAAAGLLRWLEAPTKAPRPLRANGLARAWTVLKTEGPAGVLRRLHRHVALRA